MGDGGAENAGLRVGFAVHKAVLDLLERIPRENGDAVVGFLAVDGPVRVAQRFEIGVGEQLIDDLGP